MLCITLPNSQAIISSVCVVEISKLRRDKVSECKSGRNFFSVFLLIRDRYKQTSQTLEYGAFSKQQLVLFEVGVQ